MNKIAIFGVDSDADAHPALSCFEGSRVLLPGCLCERRGLSVSDLSDGRVYFDPLLGILMCAAEDASAPRAMATGKGPLTEFANARLEAIPEAPLPVHGGANYWYRERIGSWGPWTGARQKVALIDTGIAASHSLLPRAADDSDFASVLGSRRTTDDLGTNHGTRCAGVLAARRGVESFGTAPACELSVGQLGSSGGDGQIATFDFLVLLSWAIHCRKCRVISFSLRFHPDEVSRHADPGVYTWVAQRLRKRNKALIFAAAGNSPGQIMLPAAADGIVAVSAYGRAPEDTGRVVPMEVAGFVPPSTKAEFLLGPGEGVSTTRYPNGIDHEWGGTSAACAFVAGVAALYFQAFEERGTRFTVENVIGEMLERHEQVPDPAVPERVWKGVRPPVR